MGNLSRWICASLAGLAASAWAGPASAQVSFPPPADTRAESILRLTADAEAPADLQQSTPERVPTIGPVLAQQCARELSAIEPPAVLPPDAIQKAGKPQPLLASDLGDDNSVYAVPPPPAPDSGLNAGGTNITIDFSYLNHYVYRGVDHDRLAPTGNNLNLFVTGRLSFDLGKLPHPFVGVAANIFDDDPRERFQEIRPFAGATLDVKPLLLEGGVITYVYPQREKFNTSEVYGQLTINDSFVTGGDQPLLSPYILGAFDYRRANGWYIEAGLHHDFPFEDLGIVLTAQADIAYIVSYKQLFVFVNDNDTGWQHADVGLTLSYSLNTLFNVSKRYGEFDVKGYLFYSDRLATRLTSTNTLWGGAGISFKY